MALTPEQRPELERCDPETVHLKLIESGASKTEAVSSELLVVLFPRGEH
jgi:hypothetical protein